MAVVAIASVAGFYLAVTWGLASQRRARSADNLKRIGLAIHEFHAAHGRIPGYVRAGDGTPLLSWRVALLPYLGERALYDRFRLDEPWDGPHNRALLDRMPEVFGLPGGRAAPGMTYYRSFSGPGRLFDPADREAPSFAAITHGLSSTLAAAEAREAVPWTRPNTEIPAEGEGLRHRLGGHFPGGAHFLLLDGSVRFMKDSFVAGSRLKVATIRDWDAGRDLALIGEDRGLIVPIATAGRLVLYQGLPRQANWAERNQKATVTLHGFEFYQAPVPVSAGDEAALRGLLGDASSYKGWGGGKFCDGFHPDYLAEWHAGRATYRVLICFGCGEAKIFGPGGSLHLDLASEAEGKLSEILREPRKNRPADGGSSPGTKVAPQDVRSGDSTL